MSTPSKSAPTPGASPAAARLVCAVMAGGSGTRFWPLSKKSKPKQLLTFFGETTLLAETLARVSPLCPPQRQLVITNQALVAAVRADVPQVPAAQIIGEPAARNTAPCMAVAAMVAQQLAPDAILVLLPADHWVANPEAFRHALTLAAGHADQGHIVTLGIAPTHPETGYGYIELGRELADGVHEVSAFVEKPNLETALRYMSGRRHLWNGGVFVLRADRALAALDRHVPQIGAQLGGLAQEALGTPAWQALFEQGFAQCPSVSIDYGVMEHEGDQRVVRLDAGWSDVGTWYSLAGMKPAGADNFVRGEAIVQDCRDCVVISSGPAVAAVGLRNMAVVATPEATLVLPLDRSQDVRDVVAEAQARGMGRLL